jgi:hypothetical protein
MSESESIDGGLQPASIFQGNLPLATKLEKVRTELLDLSARNRLLNIPRSSKTARTIEVVDEKISDIFRLLVRENRAFTFLPGRSARAESSEEAANADANADTDADEIEDLAQPEPDTLDERGVFQRHADTKLQTN